MNLRKLLSSSLYLLKEKGVKYFLREIASLFIKKIKARRTYRFKEELLTKNIKQELLKIEETSYISLIVLLKTNDVTLLQKTLDSLKRQWYINFEVALIVYDNSLCISGFFSHHEYSNLIIKMIELKDIESDVDIRGEYFTLLCSGDELPDNALFELVKSINETHVDFIYSDNDLISDRGKLYSPFFKSDFNAEMLLSFNYIRSLSVFKKTTFWKYFSINTIQLGGYDLLLRVIELNANVFHVKKVLYHENHLNNQVDEKTSNLIKDELQGYIKRNNINSTVSVGLFPRSKRISRKLKSRPLVSIIIPFKDKPELLNMCISSILKKSTYSKFEIIGISNNSEDKNTFKMMEKLSRHDSRVRFDKYDVPFNYSKINNYAVTLTKGEHLILLNNDIEIISNDWIESMLEYSQVKEVGAVGGLLFYPDNSIQHAGVIIGLGGVAGHSHKHIKLEKNSMILRPLVSQYISAVTAACLMIKKDLFESINGFNEIDLTIAFNDVDFCLRLREKGFLNIYTPYCKAYHHESISRGYEDSHDKIKRFEKEIKYMKSRHSKILKEGDPYYNPNLTILADDFSIK